MHINSLQICGEESDNSPSKWWNENSSARVCWCRMMLPNSLPAVWMAWIMEGDAVTTPWSNVASLKARSQAPLFFPKASPKKDHRKISEIDLKRFLPSFTTAVWTFPMVVCHSPIFTRSAIVPCFSIKVCYIYLATVYIRPCLIPM